MKKNRKKVFLIIGAILLYVVYIIVNNVLVVHLVCRIIFARNDEMTSAKYELNFQRNQISFYSGHNLLSGYIFDCDNETGLIIIAPGLNADCNNYLPIAEYFLLNNWDVLIYDYTGSCLSEGDWSIGLQQSRKDLLSAINFSSNLPQYGNTPIVVIGHSMGGYASAVVLEDTNKVAASVCICAFDNPNEFMKNDASELVGKVATTITYPFLKLYNYIVFQNESNTSASDVICRSNIPVMIIQGSKDRVVDEECRLYNHINDNQNSNNNITKIIVSKENQNGHTISSLLDEKLLSTILVFCNEAVNERKKTN